jgi:hypothetical protein
MRYPIENGELNNFYLKPSAGPDVRSYLTSDFDWLVELE